MSICQRFKKKLVRLKFFGQLVFESLEFLNGLDNLLTFGAKLKENEQNQRIIESIEQKSKNLTYPVLDAELYESLNRLGMLLVPAVGAGLACKHFVSSFLMAENLMNLN